MEPRDGGHNLSIGFIGSQRQLAEEPVVTVSDLTRVLSTFQSAVYATAAFELNLKSVRSLTAGQRRYYQLAVTGFHHSGFWTHLVPVIAVGIELSHSPGLFSLAELHRISLGQIVDVWEKVDHTIEGLRKLFVGESQDSRLERVLGKRGIKLARTAIKSGISIEVVDRQADGAEFMLRATREESERLLARYKEQRGTIREFPVLKVRDILTSQPVIKVVSERHPDELVKCKYPKGLEDRYGEHLRIGDIVTIGGVPIWLDEDSLREMPEIIEVIYLVTSDGNRIGPTPFAQFIGRKGPAA